MSGSVPSGSTAETGERDVIRETLLEFAADSIARTAGRDGQYGRREEALADLDSLRSRVSALEAALRGEFFRVLPDLDYEIDVASASGAFDDRSEPAWAWREHPWKRLLGVTDEECIAALVSSRGVRGPAGDTG